MSRIGSLGSLGLLALVLLGLTGLAPRAASAAPLPGDCNGDGAVDAADEAILTEFYDSVAGGPGYDPIADLNADGRVDVLDLALFGESFGASGGDVDTTPPALFVTLNDVPDDMNDLLVAPPDGFDVTITYDGTGSAIEKTSLSIVSDLDVGPHPGGSELAPQFSTGFEWARWSVPAGSDLQPTSHYLTVSIRDRAGNQSQQVYGFAVRAHPPSGPPMENLQTVFLDFDQDRSLGPELDFLEDLRQFNLSSTADLAVEAAMRDWVVDEILLRVHPYFDREPDGSPGPDAVNVLFTAADPGPPRARLCVGGESQFGSSYLGTSVLDVNNVNESQDDCVWGAYYGVFPQAIDDLWGGDPEYASVFSPLNPGAGGTPVGEHPLDAIVTAPGFDPASAPAEQQVRWDDVSNAVDAFSQLLASVIAHEISHTFGLVAHGPAPGGLYGGTAGATIDHNVTVGGVTPAANLIMNAGGSFSFDEMTGRNGAALPIFRQLNRAFLRNRLVLDATVTGLFPAPVIDAVAPDPVVFGGSDAPVQITLTGDDFLDPPVIELLAGGSPPAKAILSEAFVDPQTVTGWVNPLLVPPGLYDVRLTNPDGQIATLVDGLWVQP